MVRGRLRLGEAMSNGLTGKSVIVTGAAHGMGLAIARRFVRAGAAVMMADIDEDRLAVETESLADEGYDGRATAFYGDLRQRLTMANLMAATLDAHDGIDILVNASRLLLRSNPLDPEEDHLEETLALNLAANLRLSQIVARRMIELADAEGESAADRAILNVSSVFAQRCPPALMAYSVSCAGLEQMTRCLALVLAPHRIRVNALATGGLTGHALDEALGAETLSDALKASVPLGRLAHASEAAEAALFLTGTAADFITGQIMTVDGGQSVGDPLSSALG